MKASNCVLLALQCYFLLMNLTVERAYCTAPISANDARFLMRETYEFSVKYNPLFLQARRARSNSPARTTSHSSVAVSVAYASACANRCARFGAARPTDVASPCRAPQRPRWLQAATCFSAYGLPAFYLLTSLAAVSDAWGALASPLLLISGAKRGAGASRGAKLPHATRATPAPPRHSRHAFRLSLRDPRWSPTPKLRNHPCPQAVRRRLLPQCGNSEVKLQATAAPSLRVQTLHPTGSLRPAGCTPSLSTTSWSSPPTRTRPSRPGAPDLPRFLFFKSIRHSPD